MQEAARAARAAIDAGAPLLKTVVGSVANRFVETMAKQHQPIAIKREFFMRRLFLKSEVFELRRSDVDSTCGTMFRVRAGID